MCGQTGMYMARHAFGCASLYVYMCTDMHKYVCIYVCIYMSVCMYAYMSVCSQICIKIWIHVWLYMCLYVDIDEYVYILSI